MGVEEGSDSEEREEESSSLDFKKKVLAGSFLPAMALL
jgi:hypothetical protein